MRYIITESQFEKLMETEDRTSGMVKRFLDMTFANMVRVSDEDGPGYKFGGDNQYQVKVRKNNAGELQLAISSSFVKNIMSMFDVNKFEASELIGEYCSDVLDIDFDFTRIWPISINEEISEVKKVADFDENYPEYRYTSIKVFPDENNPNQIGSVYFNGPNFRYSQYQEPEFPRPVYFIGPNGEFEFESRFINKRGGSPYVYGNNLNYDYYDRLVKLMKKPEEADGEKKFEYFKKEDILKSLELAFPEYWVKETPEFSAGLRGIETIGDYLKKTKGYEGDTNEDWSVMNFFDTKAIPKMINQRWESEYENWEGSKIDWLVNILKNDREYLDELLKRQWKSIYRGFFKTEISALKKLRQMFKDEGLDATFDTFNFGHKKDRHSGIDVLFTIKGKTPRGIQIKPASKITYIDDKKIKVFTYEMSNSYLKKPGLDYILYDMGDSFYLFRNSDYKVVPNTNGNQVIHFKPPAKIYKTK